VRVAEGESADAEPVGALKALGWRPERDWGGRVNGSAGPILGSSPGAGPKI